MHDPSIGASRLRTVLGCAESGQVRPYVAKVYARADFKAAMRAKWSGEVIGGCVLHP